MQVSSALQTKMAQAGMDQRVIDLFATYYTALSLGERGIILEEDLQPLPPHSLPTLDALNSYKEQGIKSLTSTVIIKLNGGLGTSMGLTGPKSFLPVHDNLRFIDIVAAQTRALRKKYQVEVPLLMMNSAATNLETCTFFSHNSDLATPNLPTTFVHHSFPRLLSEELSPLSMPHQPEAEWSPAGHGDIYATLVVSGLLDQLLAEGKRYAFISNIDNLGATYDPAFVGYMVEHHIPFVMEVAPRREMDKKGGHLARDTKGNLLLREVAQVSPEERQFFEDIHRYGYFNSNSLWIDLKKVKEMSDAVGLLSLPLIVNPKEISLTPQKKINIFQLETAMGSAIQLFKNAAAVEIPLSRFRPVKRCDDLLILWSDRYILSENFELLEKPEATKSIHVALDQSVYGDYHKLLSHLSNTPPSLLQCTSLKIEGDIHFGDQCQCIGDVTLRNNSPHPVFLEKITLSGEWCASS